MGRHDNFRAGAAMAIFALLYSSKRDISHGRAAHRADGSYNLSGNDVLLTIVDPSRSTGATNFDFFTLSEPGDSWYDAARPWLHADQGGEKMSLLATDKKGILWEKTHNHSDFDKLYYFVAPERQFPKRQ